MVEFHGTLSDGDGVFPLPAQSRARPAHGPRAPYPHLLHRLRPGDGPGRRGGIPTGRTADPRRRPLSRTFGTDEAHFAILVTDSARARASGRPCSGASSRWPGPRAWRRSCRPARRQRRHPADRRAGGLHDLPRRQRGRGPGRDAARLTIQRLPRPSRRRPDGEAGGPAVRCRAGCSIPRTGRLGLRSGDRRAGRHRQRPAGEEDGRGDRLPRFERGRDLEHRQHCPARHAALGRPGRAAVARGRGRRRRSRRPGSCGPSRR